MFARLGILPAEPRARAATRTQLSWIAHYLDKQEQDREERWWARFESTMGLRFNREQFTAQLASKGKTQEPGEDTFISMTMALNAIVCGILEGGLVGILKEQWGLVASRPSQIGPSPDIMKAMGQRTVRDEELERIDPREVFNMFDIPKEELYQRFPFLRIRRQGAAPPTPADVAKRAPAARPTASKTKFRED